jgi:hypothetical protein
MQCYMTLPHCKTATLRRILYKTKKGKDIHLHMRR